MLITRCIIAQQSYREDPENLHTDEDHSSSSDILPMESMPNDSQSDDGSVPNAPASSKAPVSNAPASSEVSVSNAPSSSKTPVLQDLEDPSSDSSSETPNEPTFIPRRGQTFESEKEFRHMVTNYAIAKGFSIRRSKVVKAKDGSLRKRDLVCSRARTTALHKSKSKPTVRNKPFHSTGCQFLVRASYKDDIRKWQIISAKLNHNHNFVSSEQQQFMNSERRLPEEVKSEVLSLHRAGISPSQIRTVLKVKFGANSSWLYDDIYNFLYKHAGSSDRKELDAQIFIETLKELQGDHPNLSFKYKLHPLTQQLQRVIWMFPEQKVAYSRFSDVVVFDNTYSTNRFKMPFGVFTGVNNHGQSVCFAGSLVDSETTESFVWLFNSFLQLVSDNSPGVILTDDDKAIGSAIDQTFGKYDTTHRLCHWHLLRNVMKNLLHELGPSWSSFLEGFHECLREMDKDEFHKTWGALKQEYPAAQKYLLKLERKVMRWAPCYSCDVFMADMSTSQRGESINNMLKFYMDATTSLSTFLEAFASALEARAESEEFVKYREESFTLRFRTESPLEQQAYTLFTWYAFQKFQEQLVQSQRYGCLETSR
jgi:hypothetical protein